MCLISSLRRVCAGSILLNKKKVFYNKIYILKNKILKYNLTRNRRALTGRVKQTGSLLR